MSDALLSDAEARLVTALKFESVEVLKRFASISDPTRVLILIQVDEGPVRVDIPDVDIGPEEARRRRRPARLSCAFRRSSDVRPDPQCRRWLWIHVRREFAFAGHRSARRRIVVPASWGGDKRVGAEYQQEFSKRFAPRLRAGGFLQTTHASFFEDDADRKRVWGRTEWPIVREVHAGGEVAWQTSSLNGRRSSSDSVGADVVVDTRVDPLMPHNAIFVRSAVERLLFSPTGTAVRTEIDANGYVGLYPRDSAGPPSRSGRFQPAGACPSTSRYSAAHAISAGSAPATPSATRSSQALSSCESRRHRRFGWRDFGYSIFMDAGTTYDQR